MSRVEVKCINKTDRYNAHERIKSIGGGEGDSPSTRWKMAQADAIAAIESREHSFYVKRAGGEVEVVVAVSQWGNKYVKTQADREQPDNLLALPECP